ncbi:hypothetical protein [Sphingomonas paucimobilis]|uniref:hypothetical protein n=1 Tax=Sphingomonas paucimobilis TaxID=13689 RepID=UPI002430CB82|nr:hypothetical protein [Sphingomonas paucimobilis]
MTEAQLAERHARAARYAENVRHEERKRAFDIIEMAAINKPDEIAAALWNAAAEIVRHKP